MTLIPDMAAFQRDFGDALVRAGKLDRNGLERAARLADASAEQLPLVLARLGLVSERDIARALSDHLDMPLIEERDLPDAPVEIQGLSPNFLRQRRILPIAETPEGYVLAVADPLDRYALDAFVCELAGRSDFDISRCPTSLMTRRPSSQVGRSNFAAPHAPSAPSEVENVLPQSLSLRHPPSQSSPAERNARRPTSSPEGSNPL